LRDEVLVAIPLHTRVSYGVVEIAKRTTLVEEVDVYLLFDDRPVSDFVLDDDVLVDIQALTSKR
jgi:hypothetical protein